MPKPKLLPHLLLLLCAIACGTVARAQQIAFTWDDLPAHSSLPQGQTRVGIMQDIVTAMKKAGLPPAYGFVNGVRTEQEPASTAALRMWRDAGLPLGNHTWSHMNLNQHTVEEFSADTLKNEPLLREYMREDMKGEDWHWLRYPNLAEGDTPEKKDKTRAFLAAHGYRIAGVTMSFGDYAWNDPYARCVARGDTAAIASLEKSYLAAADASVDYTRAMAKALFGHDIPYVLLMHVGGLDAKMLPRLLALYKQRGFTFVTLQQAEADPFYRNDLDLSLPGSPDTLEGAMYARNLPLPPHTKFPAELETMCR
jgi:peptidoglycan/xylan/chitin deacetylase (PgdA/CDA1 family)